MDVFLCIYNKFFSNKLFWGSYFGNTILKQINQTDDLGLAGFVCDLYVSGYTCD